MMMKKLLTPMYLVKLLFGGITRPQSTVEI
nr:MAG TPA: hypothetical protein [Caudoviricetes sp.]